MLKKIAKMILSIIDEKELLRVVIQLLKEKAAKSETQVDDKIVELLENNLARIEKLAGEAKTKAVK